MEFTHASLFSGIGGFDLAAEWMGWENVFHCEWNEFGKRILKYYWPKAISYHDITKTDFTIHRGTIDVLTGGFPCQPYSMAGKRKGKADERHLWPEMLRAIREIQPGFVVGENVFGIINWDGGLVFDEVQADLEAEGYEVWPYVLPACGVNAPHKRDRVWFVAYSCNYGRAASQKRQSDFKGNDSNKAGAKAIFEPSGCGGAAAGKIDAYAGGTGWPQPYLAKITDNTRYLAGGDNEDWANFPTQPTVCNGDDGVSASLDGITLHKWRAESIKAGGNAIVPQVALQIFKTIEQYNLKLL